MPVTRPGNATWLHGLLLVACSWLSVIASGALIGPILPRMMGVFHADSGVGWKIDAVATLPALFVAVTSMPLGVFADRIGPRKVLVWAALIYGCLGIAPYFLNDLTLIVASRGVVGIAEGAVMTSSYALIGAYFASPARERWYALTTGTAPVLALLLIAMGGLLGESSWHSVFLVYSFALLLFVGIWLLLWEPSRASTQIPQPTPVPVGTPAFLWRRLLIICAVSVFAMTAFSITIIQTGFLLTERGIGSPSVIGKWQALASLSNPAGALVFGVLSWRYINKLWLSFLLMALGYAAISLRTEWQAVIWGGAIANLGCGMLLPTIVSWGLRDIPAHIRGKGVGTLMACNFFGQFLSPFIITWLKGLAGSLSGAVFCYVVACGFASLGAMALSSRQQSGWFRSMSVIVQRRHR
jgi:MFS family permease